MTTNAFIFMWDQRGIESIVPITQYEGFDKDQMWKAMCSTDKDFKADCNPVTGILRNMLLRARFNSQRDYKIYAIDCDSECDESFWWDVWLESPDKCIELISTNGLKIYD